MYSLLGLFSTALLDLTSQRQAESPGEKDWGRGRKKSPWPEVPGQVRVAGRGQETAFVPLPQVVALPDKPGIPGGFAIFLSPSLQSGKVREGSCSGV